MKFRDRALPFVLLALSRLATAEGQVTPEERLLHLSRIPGVSGHETDVRNAVASMIPAALHSETDSIGNLIVRIGSGSPRTLVVAPLDEPRYVVSAITEEGYLRLHQPTTGLGHKLAHEYHVGQPVSWIGGISSLWFGWSWFWPRGIRKRPLQAMGQSLGCRLWTSTQNLRRRNG